MEKTRRLKTFSIVALIVAVLGLSIAFAALSKTLTINGTASVDAANWDIHFKNISEPTLTGKATTTGTPSLADNGATINDMKVSLKEPGDKVVYTVDIENSGDINAEIDSITLPTFTTAQSNILDFKAVYTSNNKEISQGDILESKETKNVTITIMYKDITDESLLPKEGISVNLKYELHFIQTDKASGSSSQGGNNPSSSCTTFEKKDTYQVGDVIAICNEETGKSEDFYVISDNGSTVTALAKYNLLVGNEVKVKDVETADVDTNEPISTSTEGYGLQSAEARGALMDNTTWVGTIAFCTENQNSGYGYWYDTNTNKLKTSYGSSYPVWVYDSNSLLYTHVQNYKNYIKNTLGKTSVTATILSYEQVVGLGCVRNDNTCLSAPAWVYDTSYWLGSAYDQAGVWWVDSTSAFYDSGDSTNDLDLGVRPVITISKSEL